MFMPSPACPPSTPSVGSLAAIRIARKCSRGPYQSLHGSVQRMSVVSSELGVGAFEGWVSGGLGLLDAVAMGLRSVES